uniref:phosphatidylinositol 3-kinase n=1 Tax=Petromyzon marinus TaxID=7757 RepID=A0AAJ7TJS9_PETMA|nr:phosphatidylinositol 4,5-bisphosphate 3-kinase catalytic subunit gamma isoform-like [Petromyzon marinus]XP_032819176.1 phosphatidylinositol 4,5-bisphosphate 3-kinase catalytic subunit gamma isoform-like [Petromyzon marinus]XP_032819177.1 phosphatidylinositol 4,5-bisphosphate 3-kinase catalytic subunit gamma isoform-like [Petromyzon marinus]
MNDRFDDRFSTVQTITVEFVLPFKVSGQQSITRDVQGTLSVDQVWNSFWSDVMTCTMDSECYVIITAPPDSYALYYEAEGRTYEIYDRQQIFQTLDCVRRWGTRGFSPGRILVRERPKPTPRGQRFQEELDYLIGAKVEALCLAGDDELEFTRRRLAAVRAAELERRDPFAYALEPWVASQPPAAYLEERIAKNGGLLDITLHLASRQQSIQVSPKDSPREIALGFFSGVYGHNELLRHSEPEHAECFVFKVCGRDEYIQGPYPIVDFVWVRRCVKKNEKIHLAVAQLQDVAAEETEDDWPLLDNCDGATGTAEELSLWRSDAGQLCTLSLWDCNRFLRVNVRGIEFPPGVALCPQGGGGGGGGGDAEVYVQAGVYHGKVRLASVMTSKRPLQEEIVWGDWLEFGIRMKDLPLGACLNLSLYSVRRSGLLPSGSRSLEARLLHYVNMTLIDHRSLLRQGEFVLYMWPLQQGQRAPDPSALPSGANPEQERAAVVSVLLDTYDCPVALPRSQAGVFHMPERAKRFFAEGSVQDEFLKHLVNVDPLSPVEAPELALLWQMRDSLSRTAQSLPRLLRAVDWGSLECVRETHGFLQHWSMTDFDLSIAMELLDGNFVDGFVRRMAVERLAASGNDEILLFLLQLVQALKFEPYHDSPLARFLIQRALRSKRLGHFFFWFLRSEIAVCAQSRARFAVLLEAYLRGCGRATLHNFVQQVKLIDSLRIVGDKMQLQLGNLYNVPPNAASELQDNLERVVIPGVFQLPYDPCVRAGTIVIEKCKVLASKKKPLWLEFHRADSTSLDDSNVKLIFKNGDDLRQDMLILQTLNIMDSIWDSEGLDLCLLPYGCIATGYNTGVIEVVPNAHTVASIQVEKGGIPRNEGYLKTWLDEQMPLAGQNLQAVEKFMHSCAGYCMATYVLGIGDRHNENIMITKNGNLFHIDFGHILGNIKKFWGVSRERVPFVLTPDFLCILGAHKNKNLYFQRFVDTCCRAYLALRRHKNLLITLFNMMATTGMPEVTPRDIEHMREALVVRATEADAEAHIRSEIEHCIDKGWTVQVNWWMHLLASRKTT